MKKFIISVFAAVVAMVLPAPAMADDEDYDPDDVGNLKVTWNLAEKVYDVSFTAPTTKSYYDYTSWENVTAPLTEIEKIEVSCSDDYYTPQVLHTFESPAPGEALSCKVASLEAHKFHNFKVVVYALGKKSVGASADNVLAGAEPEKISGVSVSTTQGRMPIAITFAAPSVYAGSDIPLESLTKIELVRPGKSYWDEPTVLETITNPVPGKEYTLTVNLTDVEGAETWRLSSYNEDGESQRCDFAIFIGDDVPGAVGNLKAIETDDGSVKISWTAPTGGKNNGYFDASGMTYSISILTPGTWGDEEKTIVQAQEECEYVYTLEPLTEPATMRFGVTATNAAGIGLQTKTDRLILGPAYAMPFTEGFDAKPSYSYTTDHTWVTTTTSTENYPPEWRYDAYVYVGNTQVKPQSNEGGLAYLNTYDYTRTADFGLVSAKIDITGLPAVGLSFGTYVSGGATKSSIVSEISFDRGSTFLPVASAALGDAAAGWVKVSGIVNVPDGAQYAIVRIIAKNVTGVSSTFVVDDVALVAAEAQKIIYPASVSDFSAELNEDESAINVCLTAPTLTHPTLGDVNGEPLSSISRIVLGRQIGYGNDYTTIHTFENPTPGAVLTFPDTDLELGGEYRYRALVYLGDRSDYGNFTDQPVVVGQIPSEVTDFTITTFNGTAPATLNFRAPATDSDGKPLKKIVSINITRYNSETLAWEDLATLTENVVPGEPATYSDADVVNGNIYTYRVNVTGTAGSSYGVSRDVYIGQDAPAEPTNITVSINDAGKPEVTWKAPTAGRNNGYVDFEHLTYAIYRGNSYSDYDAILLNDEVTATTYVDETEFDDEEIVRYFVKAINGDIEGYAASSNTVVVGSPSTLPYVEGFDNKVGEYLQPDHATWQATGSESTGQWSFAELGYLILEGQVMPYSGRGLAYVFYGPYSTLERDDYLTSGNIDISAAPAPTVTFHVYGVPDYEQTLDLEVAYDGGEFTSVKHLSYMSDFKTQGWTQVTVTLPDPQGAKLMQMRFHAHKGASSCSVVIDEVRVDADASSISDVDAAAPARDNEIYDLQGRKLSKKSRGFLIINGVKTFVK